MSAYETLPDIYEQQVIDMQASIANAEAVTVDFGTASSPLFELSTDPKGFDERNLYIGVNIDSKQHKALIEKLERSYGVPDYGYAVFSALNQGAIERLPILDQTVDTVFMANLLGEPESEYIMHDFKDDHGIYRGHSTIDAKQATIQEAARLLKPNGRLILLENDTPYLNLKIGAYYAGAVALLETASLDITETLRRKDDEWQAAIRPYDGVAEWWSSISYMVSARKPSI